ncbi:chaperone modulator CbpM [Telmatospirillum sp. J64-1]|uniref:chaperone modulator CbpM n=1 Tax=Telmatospirillum sp. J64-1 TaxID=2502183 RepID=UPI00115DD47B|nr:chaperone modulator CbpM [Telmatospirillum sp. J64-1]
MTFEEVLVTFSLERADLTLWVEQSWVKPTRQEDDWFFDESDVARLQLICELKRDMAVNDEAVPVILSLLDQLYAARTSLHRIRDLIQHLPPETRAEIEKLLQAEG